MVTATGDEILRITWVWGVNSAWGLLFFASADTVSSAKSHLVRFCPTVTASHTTSMVSQVWTASGMWDFDANISEGSEFCIRFCADILGDLLGEL